MHTNHRLTRIGWLLMPIAALLLAGCVVQEKDIGLALRTLCFGKVVYAFWNVTIPV